MDIFTNGFDASKFIRAKQFQDAVVKQNDQYPKLAEINAFQIKIQGKYRQEIGE